MKFFQMTYPETAYGGDYESTLQHGALNRVAGRLEVVRAGPFAPPLAFPYGGIVATASMKAALETSGLTGFSFNPAIKEHIVKIDWETWSGKPKYYPAGGEPEAYLFRKHCPETAAAMEDLFELALEPGAELINIADTTDINIGFTDKFVIDLDTYRHCDFFRPSRDGFWPVWFVTERAKDWLEAHAAKWVKFVPIETRGEFNANKVLKPLPKIAGVPEPRFVISIKNDNYAGAQAFSCDSIHFAVEVKKGCLQIWNLEERKPIKEFSFPPLAGLKKPPDLSANNKDMLVLNGDTIWGIGSAKGKLYLLSGNWMEGTSRTPLLLGQVNNTMFWQENIAKGKAKEIFELGNFSAGGNGFFGCHGQEYEFFDLTVWPPKKKCLNIPESAHDIKISQSAKCLAFWVNDARLVMFDIARDSIIYQSDCNAFYGEQVKMRFASDDLLVVASLDSIVGLNTIDGSIRWRVKNKPIDRILAFANLKDDEWLLVCADEKTRSDLLLLINVNTGEARDFSINPDDPTRCAGIYSLSCSLDRKWLCASIWSKRFIFWRIDDWLSL